MNDAARVRRRERVRHLNPDAQSALQFQRPAVDKLPHVLAFDVLHRDEVQPSGFVHIKNGADVRMVQRRSQPCLALETFQIGFFDREFRRQDLDDDRAAQLQIGGFVNRALSARAQLVRDFIVAESFADHVPSLIRRLRRLHRMKAGDKSKRGDPAILFCSERSFSRVN